MPTDLDLPLLPSAEQIRRREFATIRRGYDPDQVRDYLLQIALQVETLEGVLREARLSAVSGEYGSQELGSGPDPYERLAVKMTDVLRAADERAERLVHDSQDEAARILAEARVDADRIRVDAQARAEEARQQGGEALRDAKLEAERVLSGLSARRETLVEQLQHMQTRLLGVAREIVSAIDEPGEAASEGGDAGGVQPDSAGRPAGRETKGAPQDPVDPRDEDLWVSRETIELDLDDLGMGDAGDPSQPDV